MFIKSNLTISQLWLISFGILLGQLYSYADDESRDIRDYQVKATYLLYFNKFVTYPKESFSDARSEINLCILGDDPFQNSLDILIKGETTQERSMKVSYIRDIEKIDACHTLFVSQSEQKQITNIIAYVKGKPILTVSDMTDFVTRGGMIQFYISNSKIRFFINPITVRESNLVISSRLLQVASVMDKGSQK